MRDLNENGNGIENGRDGLEHKSKRTGLREDFNKNLRQRVLSLIAARCCRCGFDDARALQMDHRYGGGTRERRRFSHTTHHLHVLHNPESYKVLCANCNTIKRAEDAEW